MVAIQAFKGDVQNLPQFEKEASLNGTIARLGRYLLTSYMAIMAISRSTYANGQAGGFTLIRPEATHS
jgi:hypothetical protein